MGAGTRVIQPPGGYTLQIGTSSLSPADATTYYAGGVPVAPDGSASAKKLLVPKAGTITAVSVVFQCVTSPGTSEASTVSIRHNNTTDIQISDAVDNSNNNPITNSALSHRVAAGDYLELKWVTPTWVTNPVGVRISASIYIRED